MSSKIQILKAQLAEKTAALFDEDWVNEVTKAGEAVDAMTEKLAKQMLLNDTLVNSFKLIGTAIGEGFSGAEDAFENFVESILSLAGQVVGALLAIALAKEVVDKGLVAGLIIGTIAIAAVLAFMSATKSTAANMAQGGIVPSGYPNDTYPAMLTSGETILPAKKLPQMFGTAGAEKEKKVTFIIERSVLKGILEDADTFDTTF